MAEMATNRHPGSLANPVDKRLTVRLRTPTILTAAGLLLMPVVVAWGWRLLFGLPEIPPSPRHLDLPGSASLISSIFFSWC